jgi:hypothetical protein
MREEGGEKKEEKMRIEGNRELPQKHKQNAKRWGEERAQQHGTTRVCWGKEEDEGQ